MKIKTLIILLGLISIKSYGQLEKVWETNTDFLFPESAVFDQERDLIYISNYVRNSDNGKRYGDAFISKILVTGEIKEFKWITNLTSPTGLTIAFDKLYIVERFGVVEYSLKNNSISNKWLINKAEFLNDIVIGLDTSIYVSDSKSNKIFRIKDNEVTTWIENDSIAETNGIQIKNNKLIVGVNSDNYLKSIDLTTKKIEKIAFLDEGIIDGIKLIGSDYLVSHYFGDLNIVSDNGDVKTILNTREDKIQCADFEFIAQDSLIIIPALRNKKVFAYKLKLK